MVEAGQPGHTIRGIEQGTLGNPDEAGPFDVIGDIHGCRVELEELLGNLGYRGVTGGWDPDGDDPPRHPLGRRVVFVGDITDRGPDSVGALRIVWRMHAAGIALLAPGNHENKLIRYLRGRPVHLNHGAETTAAEFQALSAEEQDRFRHAIETLVAGTAPYLILDEGRLGVAHAGIRADMIGDTSRRTIDFVLYGDTNGLTTEDGFPVRRDWAAHYRGKPLIVYGHTPAREAVLRNNTINIDTGCVFGGSLTALRYPELDLVQVAARAAYWGPARWAGGSAQ